ncbi:MAG: hypothetical protein R3F56_04505 [Planctomycetota bacterium]
MSHPYQVLGTSIPELLARRRLTEQLERHLLKPSPDHVQVVGPTLFGKSVLLHGLATRLEAADNHFVSAAYVDLRHAPPTDDAAFRRRFAEVVKRTVAAAKPDVAEYIDLDDEGIHELLDLAFQELEQQGARILVVLDGFDHVLAGTGITRNLWDQLRSLAQKPSLRLVTGSRQPLRELCKTEESRTSDFWEIFYDTPVVVGPFAEDDWDDLLAPLTGSCVTVDGSGRKELINWSGGVPVLAASLLERLATAARNGSAISKAEIDKTAVDMLEQPPAHLEQLWDDCDFELRADVAALAEKESDGILLSEFSTQRQRALLGRGYGVASGNRMRPGCRLMARYALQQGPAVADLNRLFGSRSSFEDNVRGVLEMRLAQVAVSGGDQEMLGYLKSAVRDLEPNPELALKWVRSIASRAMAVIWDLELEPGRKIPDAWIKDWQHSGESLAWLDSDRNLPRRQGAQCNVLRLMTGTERVARSARVVTKRTTLLIDALQSVGDFGQHREDYPECTVNVGFASAVVFSAIELMESMNLDRDAVTRGREQQVVGGLRSDRGEED